MQCSNDFRPDYKKLGILKQQFPDTPVLALTATATQQARGEGGSWYNVGWCCRLRQCPLPIALHTKPILDLVSSPPPATLPASMQQVCAEVRAILRIEASELFRSSINRPNLFYEARGRGRGRGAVCSVPACCSLPRRLASSGAPALVLPGALLGCGAPAAFCGLGLMCRAPAQPPWRVCASWLPHCSPPSPLHRSAQVAQKPAAGADLVADIARWIKQHYPGGESGAAALLPCSCVCVPLGHSCSLPAPAARLCAQPLAHPLRLCASQAATCASHLPVGASGGGSPQRARRGSAAWPAATEGLPACPFPLHPPPLQASCTC